MKKGLFLGLLLMASVHSYADPTPIDEELAARSGLPVTEIREFLANCGLNRQGLYFCTWSDFIVAERGLQKVVGQRDSRYPELKLALSAQIEHWKKKRDLLCQSARDDFGVRSHDPIAVMACKARLTEKIAKAMTKNDAAIPCKNTVHICYHDMTSQ
jgi:hypothetical protein